MTTDRFLVSGQFDGESRRTVRRRSCGFSPWGDLPAEFGGRPGRRGGSSGGAGTGAPAAAPKLPVEYTRELTPLEQAVATVLPLWPDAMEAVHKFAAEVMGIVIPSPGPLPGGGGGRGGLPDGAATQ